MPVNNIVAVGCLLCCCLATAQGRSLHGLKTAVAAGPAVAASIGIKWWPGGVVPYVLPAPIGKKAEQASIQRIISSFAHYHQHTSIRFVPRLPTHSNYIKIQWGEGCASMVGLQETGPQLVTLEMMGDTVQLSEDGATDKTAGCSVGDIIHEMGHAIGFSHEQQRSDRDKFLDVKTENIKPEFLSFSGGYAASATKIDILPYDYGSIMHYEPAGAEVFKTHCMSASCSALIPKAAEYQKWKAESNYGHDTVLGQKDGLSHTDLKEISILFGTKSGASNAAAPMTLRGLAATSLRESLRCGFGGLDGTCKWESGFYSCPAEARGSDFPFVSAAGTDYDPGLPAGAANDAQNPNDVAYLQFNTKHLSTVKQSGMTAALYSPAISPAQLKAQANMCLTFQTHLGKASSLVLEVKDGNEWLTAWNSSTVEAGAWVPSNVPFTGLLSSASQLRFVAQVSPDPIHSSLGIDNIDIALCSPPGRRSLRERRAQHGR